MSSAICAGGRRLLLTKLYASTRISMMLLNNDYISLFMKPVYKKLDYPTPKIKKLGGLSLNLKETIL